MYPNIKHNKSVYISAQSLPFFDLALRTHQPDSTMCDQQCRAVPFFGLLIMTVGAIVPLTGGTWLEGVLAGMFSCSMGVLVMTVRMMFLEGRMVMRVFVDDDIPDAVVDVSSVTVQGLTRGMGSDVVVGMPVDINRRHTVEVNMPDVVIGMALVLHDDQRLREAGVVYEHQGLRAAGVA